MKRIFCLIFLGFIVISCSEIQQEKTDSAISVEPSLQWSTKAPITGTTFPNQAFVMGCYNGSAVFTGVSFSKSGSVWVSSPEYYWPQSGTSTFLAYSCPGLSVTPTWSSAQYSISFDNRTTQSDILYAGTKASAPDGSGNLGLTFCHAQALLRFTARAYANFNSGSNVGVSIESISIPSLLYNATLNVSVPVSTVQAMYTITNTTGSATAASGTWNLTTSSAAIGNGYMVVPQSAVPITVNYTYHKGGSNVSRSYTFTPSGSWSMGNAYTYDIYIGEDAEVVSVTASATVDGWQDASLRLPEPGLFAGLQIAPGSLYYQDGHKISSTWNYAGTTWESLNRNGSTLFLWSNVSHLVSPGISYDDYDGWRIPSKGEWDAIVGTTRNGSTVNGSTNKHYAYIQVTGVSYGDYANPYGLLLFPDNRVLKGTVLNNMDNMTANTLSNNALDAYLDQGCIFLEAGGGRGTTSNYGRGTQGVYLSSNTAAGNPYALKFSAGTLHTNDHLNQTVGEGGTVRLVRTY